jgi:RHS repeat-associated protein
MLYKEFWLSSGTNPKIEMTYDLYGNQKTLDDANPNHNITATDYDAATYTNPVKVTYPQTGTVTHIIENDPNYKYGSPNWTKDENGNFTYYTYDNFGRIQQVDSPDGGQITTEYYDNAVPIYTVTKVKENISGQTMDKYGYFDGLGRSIQTITFGEAGKSIVTKTHYSNMGRVELTEGPFFSTGTGYPKQPPSSYPWVQALYDYRGRPSRITIPDIEYSTVTANYSYSGLSSTLTDPDGKKKTTRRDYLGRVVEVKEYDNNAIYTTTYAYNVAGDLRTVTDHYGNLTSINYDTLGRKINMQDTDMGYWQYTYDPNGNLWTQKDPKNQTITFNYDALNRITTKTYSTSDPTVTYTYDNLSIPNGRGRFYTVSNTNVTTTYNSYDKMGRGKSATEAITGAPAQYTTLNEYDLSGKTTKTTYPDNFYVINSYYPGTGLLEKVTGSNGVVYATNTLYEPAGKIGQINHQNGTATRYTYDNWSTKLTAIITTSPSSNGNPRYDVINRGYSYSRAGDINTITDYKKGAELGLAGNIFNYQYTYDNIHRLAGEVTTNNTYNPAAYVYDATGNISTKVTGANVFAYAYDPLHKHAVKTITFNSVPYTYQYDSNGNMYSGPDFTDLSNIATRQITYNADNMPVQVTHSRYGVTNIVYDGEGGRAKKVSPSVTTYYIGEHYEIINGVSTKYIFAGNLRIAKVTASGTNYFHKDHLGSSSAMTDSSGAVVETTNYAPFGEQREHTGAVVTNYKFTDQELDSETGLYYYGARFYDPAIGRFISADTIVPGPYNPQALNRYSYVLNSPLIYIDPTGHLFSLDPFTGKEASTVMDDWMGVEQVDATVCYYSFCAQGSVDFTNNDVRQTQVGVGVGAGATGTIRFSSFDLSAGYGWAVIVGYGDNGAYASAYGGYGNVSASGTYYFKYDAYQVGAGAGYGGFSASVGYSNYGGWSAGAGYGGASYTYNFDSGEGRFGFYVDVQDLSDAYKDGVNSRQYGNGYRPENGNRMYIIVDFIGTVTAGWQAAENHDIAYGKGLNKNAADFGLFRDMVGGSISNISHSNGLIRAGIGLAISPLYYGAVAVGGGSAYSAAHP